MSTPKEETKQWRKRELRRLEDGTYKGVPWAKEGWYLNSPFGGIHFGHTSVSNPALVAYTPDYNKGERDVRNSTKPRKYLAKHFQDVLGDSGIERWAGEFIRANNPVIPKIARTREEIRWVYENGQVGCNPSYDDGTGSCMTYPTDSYKSRPVHPCEVYAFDLGIAYILHPKGHEKEGMVCARSTVWPEKLQYWRVFGRWGNEDTLRLALEGMGYEQKNHKGARLLKIFVVDGSYKDHLVAPFLDCYSRIRVDDDCLVLAEDGNCRADSQGGLLQGYKPGSDGESEYDWDCADCGSGHNDGDESVCIDGHGTVCWACYEDNYSTCDDCEEIVTNDSVQPVCGDRYVCDYCYSNDYFYCEWCDTALSNDDCAGEAGDETVCNDCLDDSDEYRKLDCGAIGRVKVVQEEVTTAECSCCGVTELNREEV